MLFLSCVCYAFVHVCLLMPCGHSLGKSWPLGSCLSLIVSIGILGQVWYLIASIPDLCPLSYFDYHSCFVCAAWWPYKVSPHVYLMLLLFQSSGLCVQSPSIIPFPGYPLCLVSHHLMIDFHTPLYSFCFLYLFGLVLAIWIIDCICYALLCF